MTIFGIMEVVNQTCRRRGLTLVRERYSRTHPHAHPIHRKQKVNEDLKISEHAADFIQRRGCCSWLFACCCFCDPHSNENVKTRKVHLQQYVSKRTKADHTELSYLAHIAFACTCTTVINQRADPHYAQLPRSHEGGSWQNSS